MFVYALSKHVDEFRDTLTLHFFHVCIRLFQVCVYVVKKFVYVLFGVYTPNVKRTYTHICTFLFVVLHACLRAAVRVYTLDKSLSTHAQIYVYARPSRTHVYVR